MIVPMKKITLLIGVKHRDDALKELRKLGVLHIQDIKPPLSEDIQMIETRLDNTDRALQMIGDIENGEQTKTDFDEAASRVDSILSLAQKRDALVRELEDHQQINKWYKKWGAVSYNSLQELKESGVFIRLYVTDKNALKKVPQNQFINIVSEDQGTIYCALVSDSPDEKLEFKEEAVPQIEPTDVEHIITKSSAEIEHVGKQLKELSRFHESINAYRNNLLKRLELNRVKYGMAEAEEIAFLQGFTPVDAVPQIKESSDRNGWGYVIQDPNDVSEVPTLLHNPKWLRIIKPLFDFMGTLPGYQEQDVSFVFLGFFSLFYAMLVGDAGYGFVFLIMTLLIARKKKGGPREFFYLMYVLSFSTIIWGLITGNWFGVEAIGKMPLLKNFIIPQLDTFSEASTPVIMQFCFIIGVVQLSVAHLLSALKKWNSLVALAEIGWILVLWAVFFVANNLILKKPLPGFTGLLLICGVAIIWVFANFQKNILKGMLITLGSLPFGVIGAFGDIVSYIRLFAVGLASFIVANSFNNLVVGDGINNVISGIFAAIILFLAHGLNIVLSGMSVLVHGVRLNILEFSSHVGIQWVGKPYKPFKE